jgi:hypothetical protein
MEPKLVTDPRHVDVLRELVQREPIFHRPEQGTTRRDFDRMMDAAFREIGASGRRYSRDHVLDALEERQRDPSEESWQTSDFHVLEIAADNYLLTYTLAQGARITRRSTLWRRAAGDWKIVFHQGTVVADAQT